jgi:hypothetical protein
MPLLIDADVHISPTPQGGNSITIDELLLRMNRSGVDKAGYLAATAVRPE